MVIYWNLVSKIESMVIYWISWWFLKDKGYLHHLETTFVNLLGDLI
jgi:hypothetical protein